MSNELFLDYLRAKELSDQTLKYYILYCDKLEYILEELDHGLNQEVINVFLTKFSNAVSRAFLKNYLKFLNRNDLEIPALTGKRKKKLKHIISKDHMDKLRDRLYNRDIKWGLILDLTYYGALRRNEVINVRLQDFNIEDLNTNPKAYPILIVRNAKFKKERKVVVPKLLIKAIMYYAKEKQLSKEDRLFNIKKERWWEVFHEECIKFGFFYTEGKIKVSLYSPHSIRHSKASEWRNEGVDIISIQHRLGHSDISTTRMYVNVEDKKEEDKWAEEINDT